MQTEKAKTPSKGLNDVAKRTYPFQLLDGTQLALSNWTIQCDLWASETFGSMKKLREIFVAVVPEDDGEPSEEALSEALNASLTVAAYNLDENSRRIVEERRNEGETTEKFIARHIDYNILATLCFAIFNAITDASKDLKKKQPVVNPVTRKR